MNAICPNCGVIERPVAQQIGGKISFGLAAAAFGNQAAKKNPWIGVTCAVVGLMIGHYIDQELSKKCPQCGAILREIGLLP